MREENHAKLKEIRSIIRDRMQDVIAFFKNNQNFKIFSSMNVITAQYDFEFSILQLQIYFIGGKLYLLVTNIDNPLMFLLSTILQYFIRKIVKIW